MRAFCFIFARGGSKGLPGKNVRPLAGKPLIAHSIEVAHQVPELERVFVSTEDAEIAAVAREYGATVIDRPAELAEDTSPEWLAWRHAIEWVRTNVGDFDEIVSLPATSPLRSVEDVQAVIQTRRERGADVCMTVTPSSTNPYFTMVTLDEQQAASLVLTTDRAIERRQDAPAVYDITAVAYVMTPEFVMSQPGMFSGHVVAVSVPKQRAVDIDDIYDFKLAEVLLAGD
ncbi:MAG: acylneuraminate cytidylyltransferase family protein [Polyangiaceae bacterium]